MGIQTHVEDLEPVSWALMALAILLVIVRLTIRYTATRQLRTEDIMVGVALLMDIGATVSLALAVQLGGLGKHRAGLTEKQNDARTKANYAQHLLYIAVIATAKISMTVFFRRLAVKKIHHRVIWALAIIIALWAISSEFIVAFQCPMPHPWDPTAYPAGSCLPEKIWLYVTVVDCLTEAMIMALPFWIIYNVRIPRRKKWLIQTLFAFRIVVIAASITRYVASQARATSSTTTSVSRHQHRTAVTTTKAATAAAPFDTSYDQTGYWLWTDLHSTIAIIAACIPALKPFLEWSAGRIAGNISSASASLPASYGFQRSARAGGYVCSCSSDKKKKKKAYPLRAMMSSGGRDGGDDDDIERAAAVADGGSSRRPTVVDVRESSTESIAETEASEAGIIDGRTKKKTEWEVMGYYGNSGMAPRESADDARRERGVSAL
ncbi:uncharacterized protein LTHEOB_7246 [Lasiodiplodia theobromae]|uniref:uncharacterized protein n=1 Tax=Lasiodiplodia theobromae TaxID=45133 RepID=UPI0015C2D20A|nr:uncharacterized protein LTHEOB_7246 [Lasiodiplodia theobromae]KAF4542992.1 hypothetical protein LTHEOB_7246 [Lasiodiplodia theobromae]